MNHSQEVMSKHQEGKTVNSKGGEAGKPEKTPGTRAMSLGACFPKSQRHSLSLGPTGSGWPVGHGQQCGADAAG